MSLMKFICYYFSYVILIFQLVNTETNSDPPIIPSSNPHSTQDSQIQTTYQLPEISIPYSISETPIKLSEITSSINSETQSRTTYQPIKTTTSYSISGPITNLSIKSIFPSSPLNITWGPPQSPTKEIVQYFIWVQNLNNNSKCVLTTSINCTGCTDNILVPGLPDNDTIGCRSIAGTIFNSTNTIFSIIINDPLILPYSNYIIHVIPLNKHGWGDSTNQSFETSQYISSGVLNMSTTSHFPAYPLLITWASPIIPNGKIVQYFLWVKNLINDQCVLRISLNCSDCTNNISVPNWPDNKINECKSIQGTAFNSTNTKFSIIITNSLILPYSNYTINVRPLNGYGWGNETNQQIQTNQYISGSVINLSANSSFPSFPVNIIWEPPQYPNGEIVQYFIWVQNPKNNNSCVVKMFIDCTDCRNNVSNISSTENCKEITKSTFNSTNTKFSIIFNDPLILPYSDYVINVRPKNGYGWGNETNQQIRTNQYKSSGVSNLIVISINQSSIVQISWEIPLIPNGKIVQYFIWIGNTSHCVLKMASNCTDCGDNKTIPEFPDNNIIGCKQIAVPTFTSINNTFSIIVNDSSIFPYSNYTIQVTPLNGFGWGDSTNKSFSTPSYISGPVENLFINSSFLQYPLQVIWETPKYPNGEIFKYFIVVESINSTCVLTKAVVCTSCNDISPNRPDRNIGGCSAADNDTFNTSNKSFAIIIKDLKIQPNTQYYVDITPLNAYGWGQSIRKTITTGPYIPDSIENLNSKVEQTNISIDWTPPNIHSLNFYYFIQFTNQTFKQNYTASKNVSSFNFPDVEYCSQYNICITVIDDYNIPSSLKCVSQTTNSAKASISDIKNSASSYTISLEWTYLSYSNCKYFAKLKANEIPEVSTIVNNHTFSNLKPFTSYNFTITPFTYREFQNQASPGVSSVFTVVTKEAVPSLVSNFNCFNLSYTAISCEWKQPEFPNGNLLNYWISCKREFLVFNSTVVSTSVNITAGIATNILYTCQINASTSVGYGNSTFRSLSIQPAAIAEIIKPDSIPTVMSQSNVKVTDEYTQLSITLPYGHFTNNFGTIQMFTLVISQRMSDIVRNGSIPFLSYKNQAYSGCVNTNPCTYEIHLPDPKNQNRKRRLADTASSWQNAPFVIGNNKTSTNILDYYSNGPLNSGTLYVIGFRAYTSTGFVTVGLIPMKTVANKIAIIIGVTVGAFIIIIIIIGVYFRIRYKRNKLPAEPPRLLPIDHKSPAVHEFPENFEVMKKDSNGRLIDDFQEIKDQIIQLERQRILQFSEGNDTQNRYSNIKPYKHNRVKLHGKNDYINASRICVKHLDNELDNQCTCNNIYIATQGPIGENKNPKLCTIGDFWRMIMENNVCVIVNLTRVEEHGKEKCSQYWPSETNNTEAYISNDENIEIKLQSFTDYVSYVERVFQVTMNKKKILVTQLQMLAWLDHSCPKTSDFLKFYEHYKKVRQNSQSVVVHCSAGVGRTGTFILIDEELSRISKETDKIEIFNNLLKLRKCRCQMVQTDSQYCFIYTIVHEYLVQSGLIKVFCKDQSNSYAFRQSYVNPIFVE